MGTARRTPPRVWWAGRPLRLGGAGSLPRLSLVMLSIELDFRYRFVMPVAEYQVRLSGRPVGDAFNNWYFVNGTIPGDQFTTAQVNTVEASLAGFYTAISDAMAGGTVATFDPQVKMINETDGQLTGIVSGDISTGNVSGSSAASGTALHSHVKLHLRTETYRDGRELRGGCFIGPTGDQAITSDGGLHQPVKTQIETAGVQLLQDLGAGGVFLVVWRRPRPASSNLGARAGSLALVQRISAWDKIAVLRSRRD